MPLASGDIIRIEEVSIVGMRRSIVRNGRRQHKGFEKPTGMREMPLGGAHIRHRLNDIIFSHQGPAESLGEPSYPLVTSGKCLPLGCLSLDGGGRRVMNSLGDSHVPLLFRVVFDVNNLPLHTRHVTGYTLSRTKGAVSRCLRRARATPN